jgi:hypothetical protein
LKMKWSWIENLLLSMLSHDLSLCLTINCPRIVLSSNNLSSLIILPMYLEHLWMSMEKWPKLIKNTLSYSKYPLTRLLALKKYFFLKLILYCRAKLSINEKKQKIILEETLFLKKKKKSNFY